MAKKPSFKFSIPVDVKKSDETGAWKIKGIASTQDPDLQGEEVLQEGLDISLLKAGRGLFNLDHKKDPEYVLGQIEDADFVKHDGKTALEVQGYLFDSQPKAKALYNIMQSVKKANGPRVHMSIEGKVLERDVLNPKKIKKARIDKVALTLDPVNPFTFADLAKSFNGDAEIPGDTPESEDEITISRQKLEGLIEAVTKALAAGAPSGAPGARTGGAAMQSESLDADAKTVTHKEKKKKLDKGMVKSVVDSLWKAFPEKDPKDLVEMTIEAFIDKLSSFESKETPNE